MMNSNAVCHALSFIRRGGEKKSIDVFVPTAIQLSEMGGSNERKVVQSKEFGAYCVGKQFVQVVGRNVIKKQCSSVQQFKTQNFSYSSSVEPVDKKGVLKWFANHNNLHGYLTLFYVKNM